MIRAGLERGLEAELTEHLGYEKHEYAAREVANFRNGESPKTVSTRAGDIDLAVPWDRAGTFIPRLVPNGSRHTGHLADMIVILYTGGMTARDIEYHLSSTIGTELARETISKITNEVIAWRAACRPFSRVNTRVVVIYRCFAAKQAMTFPRNSISRFSSAF